MQSKNMGIFCMLNYSKLWTLEPKPASYWLNFYHCYFSSQKRSKLTGYVVAGGLQYGKGESLFHYFFKVNFDWVILYHHHHHQIMSMTICLIFSIDYFYLYFPLDSMVNAASESSCVWIGHRLHSHDSRLWPWRVMMIKPGLPIYLKFIIMFIGILCIYVLNWISCSLRVIQNVIDLRPKSQYILAVDDSKNTLEDTVKVTP